MKHWKGILAIVVSLGLALALLPLSITGANGTVTVSIDAPAEVNPGSSFVANVTVDYVENYDACGFDVTYDQTIITVTDVTGGEIDGHAVEVDWVYYPSGPSDPGKIRVLAVVPGMPGPGVTGTGHIAQINFNVLGSSCETSAIHLEGVGMYDYEANKIDTTTVDDSVHVAAPFPLEITTTSLPEAKVGDYYEATLEATGGQPPYNWGATGLPGGLSCSTAGVISGTPTASGDFTPTVTVTDDAGPPDTDSKGLALKVYPALEITTTTFPNGYPGNPYTTTLAATGGKTPHTWGATGLPAGLACSADGVISGTPTESGDFTATVNVTDSFSTPNTDSKILALKVYAALEITTTSLPEAKVGDAYSATLAASGGQPPYTWGATGLPAGLTCSTAGVISGTPTESGDLSVTVTATDSFSTPNTDQKILALKVYPPLEITTTSLPEAKVGDAYSATLTAIGGKTPYTWGATGLPAGLTCSTAGVISGTPTASGDFSVTVTVTDSFSTPNTAQTTLALKVYPPLEITTTSLPEAKVGDAYSATFTAIGGKTPYTWGATGLPAGLTCSTAGVISGTPTESGDFTATVNVTDSFSTPNTDEKVLALKVYAALEITTTSLPEAKEEDAYSATLTATGGKTPRTWVATGLPTGLTCSTAGVISGTPEASGDFSVTVTVTDSFSTPNTDQKILALKVYAALEITTTSLPNIKIGYAYSTTLVATGGKTPRTWGATGLPAGLTCSLAGVISGTPTASGGFSVTVTVTDSFTTPNTDQKILALFVCIVGDANGDGVVDSGDITKAKRIYFELDPPTDCADVNGDEMIDTGDITAIKTIYFS
ncbi:MAG: putative Ig domain-containing protein [Dehalococcoidia bacterium]